MACVGAREHEVVAHVSSSLLSGSFRNTAVQEGTDAGCFGSTAPILEGVDAWWLVSRDSQAHGKVRILDGCYKTHRYREDGVSQADRAEKTESRRHNREVRG